MEDEVPATPRQGHTVFHELMANVDFCLYVVSIHNTYIPRYLAV